MQTSPPRPAAAPRPNTAALPLAFAAAFAAIVGTLAGVWFFARGMMRGEDVGELPELAAVQAQLMPLDACEIRYSPESRYQQSKYVHVAPCTGESFPPTVTFAVPEEWKQKRIAFTAERSSPRKRWKIRVDKGAVPFPDLVKALEGVAPTIARDYPSRLTTRLAEVKKAQDEYEAQQAERERARKRAKQSYPEP